MYSLKVANIVKLAAILFMQIRWSQMKTQLVKWDRRFRHTLFMLKTMFDLFIAKKWAMLYSKNSLPKLDFKFGPSN